MLTVTGRRNRNFSARCSVAACIALSIVLLAVLLASPARAAEPDPRAFEFKRKGSNEIQCTAYKGETCSGDISETASLELGKCYNIKVGHMIPKRTRYAKLLSIKSEEFEYLTCNDKTCTRCVDKPRSRKFICDKAGVYVSPLCTAVPAN
eukprot:Nk52_evm1s2296 gene=Nk52_evmTU1s2296